MTGSRVLLALLAVALLVPAVDAPGGRVLKPRPDATWGLHLSDVNLPYGNLTALVRREAAAYLARR